MMYNLTSLVCGLPSLASFEETLQGEDIEAVKVDSEETYLTITLNQALELSRSSYFSVTSKLNYFKVIN